ncbi:MAG: phage virion morphogenesis protein [Kangiella sp.]|nr:phage virion morphogenesis protein [Kangiella sp.]MCW9028105.1 phage virion morphogenesis protein [Kangiella sp.]
MAGVRYHIAVDSIDAITGFQKLIERAEDLEPVLREIGEHLLLSTDERFDAAESPDGQPWQELSPKYKARKKRNADKILVLDAYLKNIIYQVEGNTLEFGTDKIYGATHQLGDDDRNIPAREFLGVSSDDEIAIVDIVDAYLANPI